MLHGLCGAVLGCEVAVLPVGRWLAACRREGWYPCAPNSMMGCSCVRLLD